ncbi:hypothetical protein B484DRAFT_391774 [Ochromonadaceae sp. CCMP2298]|nr:hypothetical protein B484DRAFT_391774 [Ochromonadaceae sp. CCMP2298]
MPGTDSAGQGPSVEPDAFSRAMLDAGVDHLMGKVGQPGQPGGGGVFELDLSSNPAVLWLLTQGALWKTAVDARRIKSHMEDDVGIDDTGGVAIYAALFADALRRGPTLTPAMVEGGAVGSQAQGREVTAPALAPFGATPPTQTPSHCMLHLEYVIDGHRFEGHLSLDSAALSTRVYEMMVRALDYPSAGPRRAPPASASATSTTAPAHAAPSAASSASSASPHSSPRGGALVQEQVQGQEQGQEHGQEQKKGWQEQRQGQEQRQ